MPYPTSFNSVMRDNVMRMRPVFQQTSRPVYSNDRCTGHRDGRRFIQTAINAPRPPPKPSSPAPVRVKEALVAAGNSSNFLDTGQPQAPDSASLPAAQHVQRLFTVRRLTRGVWQRSRQQFNSEIWDCAAWKVHARHVNHNVNVRLCDFGLEIDMTSLTSGCTLA